MAHALFVGGPWDRVLRPVPSPPPDRIALPERHVPQPGRARGWVAEGECGYVRRRFQLTRGGVPVEGVYHAYVCPEDPPSDAAVRRALWWAVGLGLEGVPA